LVTPRQRELAHGPSAHFHDAPYYQPRRPRFWRFLKRYQLVELMLIVGGIMLIWFGLSLGPRVDL
jgi:hypothetical protein